MSAKRLSLLKAISLASAVLCIDCSTVTAAVETSLTGTSYSQNFDGMTTSTTSTLPGGWAFSTSTALFTGAGATTTTTQSAGTTGAGVFTGSSAGGNYLTVSGVLASGTDKAIGVLNSGSHSSPRNIILGFTNDIGTAITELFLGWDYEKYRSGTRAWDWSFFVSEDDTAWGAAIATGAQAYAGDANNTTVFNPPATTSTKSVTLTGLNIAPGESFFLRWNLVGNGGSTNGQALAIDNFSLRATLAPPTDVVPEPGTLLTFGGCLLLGCFAAWRRSPRL